MKELYINCISDELGISPWQAQQCSLLLEEGATIPFISRYRKERTGGLDESQIAQIKYLRERFIELDKRKETVLATLESSGNLSDSLKEQILSCVLIKDLEDLYLPFRPKRKTRASAARDKGLEPLAQKLASLEVADPLAYSSRFVSMQHLDISPEEAMNGAGDIISELISEDRKTRDFVRGALASRGILSATLARKGREADSEGKYANYYNFSEPLSRVAPHRLLAVLRAESEGVLSLKIECEPEKICNKIEYEYCKARKFPSKSMAPVLRSIVEDSFKRLIYPSISSEVMKDAKEKADLASVNLFGDNLRQLLLAPPLGEKRVLAIDPGFRTGCKIVCLDRSGSLLAHDVIYPHPPANERIASVSKITALVGRYGIEAIAVGNGTAGRETEAFLKKVHLPDGVKIFSVSEDGASVYSASDVAREEFPDKDVTVRGAVSIGRRLMDPLAELVKIDPKSIGVGQYQHDVDQALLRERLDDVVISCVNSVGVNINTASKHILTYVSGIGPSLAENIVSYRNDNGPFTSRSQLAKVKRLGDKAFEQCAAFLRIPGADNPLDNSAVHPESYRIVDRMAADLGVCIKDLIGNRELVARLKPDDYVGGSVGLPTVNDILSELLKPGRDPRSSAEAFEFDTVADSIEDLVPGMEMNGIVTNITAFGAFVDFGLKQNGLIHISKMGRSGISSFKIRQKIRVRVLNVDFERKRISLEPA